jgi:hypothetical protein
MSTPQIKMSFMSYDTHDTHVPAVYPWPEDTFLQGGTKGLVISSKGNYRTAFVEAFADNSFFRGEGATLEEAEQAVWDKYTAARACVHHDFEPHGYHNGAGFCKHCNKFAGNVFTGEQLGQFCGVCGAGTTHANVKTVDDVPTWFCELHNDQAYQDRYDHLRTLDYNEDDIDDPIRREVSLLEFYLDINQD